MKTPLKTFLCLGLFAAVSAPAQLQVTVSSPKVTGQKAVVALALTNGLPEKVESVRAAAFLMDPSGNVVGRGTRWIVGGTEERPGMAPGATNTFLFVITGDQPFATTNLTAQFLVNRVVLSSGELADPTKTVTIQPSSK